MEQLGFWELIHATSAGGVSIAAFEGMREVAHGPILIAGYAVAMAIMFKLQQLHLKRVRAQREADQATDAE